MNLKTFAQQSRVILLKGVERKLHYWGFTANGEVTEEPLSVPGGYMFRGEAFDDPSVVAGWRSLRNAVKQKGIEAVMEEAAYTWFNRMMAIFILSKNGYDLPQLDYAGGHDNVPVMLQRARRGTFPFLNTDEKIRLQKIINDFGKELQAFGLLLTAYCHAHPLLQRVFGRLDDYTELLLPDDILSNTGFLHLLNTTDAISDDEYKKVELIGWLYQFYISEKKDEVFKKFKQNKKAEAADIPAATQIFTPNWIVKYMVENTVGKIWLELHPDSSLRERMKYLVENSHSEISNTQHPTYNTELKNKNPELPFPKTLHASSLTPNTLPLITEISQLKLLDPAAGSGHILVEGFDLLFEMYLEEYYSDAEAVESILKNNLFGLDIDKRAAQLAQFAILLKAAQRYPDVLKKDWRPQVFAMPDPTDFSPQELMDFLGSEGRAFMEPLQKALELMKQSQNLGSVMQFSLTDEARQFIVNRLHTLESQAQRNFHEEAILQRIQLYVAVLEILTGRYDAIAANPPYMGQKNMNGSLKDYVNEHYPNSKSDLYAVFIELMIERLAPEARMGCITMESWMFLSSYEKLRESLLKNYSIVGLAHFGWHIIGIAFGTATLILEKSKSVKFGEYSYLTIDDIDRPKNIPFVFPKKDNGRYANIPQTSFSNIPGSPIAYWVNENVVKIFNDKETIESRAKCRKGLTTSKDELFVRNWFEISIKLFSQFNPITDYWMPLNKGGGYRKWYGNRTNVINWLNDGQSVKNYDNSYLRAEEHFRKEGITWNAVSAKTFAARYLTNGFIFNDVGPSIVNIPNKSYLLGWLNSNSAGEIFKILCPTMKFEVGMLQIFPINYSNSSERIETLVDEQIFKSKNDWDSRETSWDFEKHPLLNGSINLQKAYETWYNKAKEDFFYLHGNEEELNRIFIDIYGLQEELTPEVALKDITILQEELDFKKLEKLEPQLRKLGKEAIELPIKKDEVMRQLISYAIGVFMGRYRLDNPGLHLAHPNPAKEEIAAYEVPLPPWDKAGRGAATIQIDEDAIIPLMGSYASFSDDAFLRVKYFLEVIWGADSLVENINFMQSCLDEDLESYLVKGFWKDHCHRYKKKPIYWLFSSPKGAFQVLVYMHRMNAFTAEKIRGNYLMEHLKFLRGRIQRMETNISGLSSTDARTLDKLRRDLDECELYDQQLKTIADKQITFDLDNGVDVNYQLFKGVVAEIK